MMQVAFGKNENILRLGTATGPHVNSRHNFSIAVFLVGRLISPGSDSTLRTRLCWHVLILSRQLLVMEPITADKGG
jgi:hypothetical protein